LSAPWEALELSRATRAAGGEAVDAAQQAIHRAQAYGKVIVTANYQARGIRG
jgi:hypothetical protein